jgi:hypothetical protein
MQDSSFTRLPHARQLAIYGCAVAALLAGTAANASTLTPTISGTPNTSVLGIWRRGGRHSRLPIEASTGLRRALRSCIASREHPELPFRINCAIQTIAPKLVCRFQKHVRACRTRSCTVRIDVIDIDINARVKRGQRAGAGNWTQPRTDLAKHDLTGSMCELCVCESAAWIGAFKDPMKTERFFEKSSCTTNVLVKEVGCDIWLSQHITHCKSPLPNTRYPM